MGTALTHDAERAGLAAIGWDRRSGEPASKAVADAEVVVTMVTDADAVMSVMHDQGAFSAMKPGAAWVQMATIGVAGTERAMKLAATRPEIVFIDAPVSGSKTPAEQGKLVIFASGDQARAGEPVQRFFDAIGTKTHWLGAAGRGTRMKLVFNAWLGIVNEGVAETVTLANFLGIEPQLFASIAAGGPLVPPWAIGKIQKITEGRTGETEFPLRWAEKDLKLALEAADSERARLPILDEIAQLWEQAVPEFGTQDLSAIYAALQHNSIRR